MFQIKCSLLSLPFLYTLQQGIPSERKSVSAGNGLYFEFTLDSTSHNTNFVSLTVLYGDPDLYITKCREGETEARFPSRFDADWESLTNSDRDVIVLPHGELSPNSCKYRILVYGFRESQFKILWSSGGMIELRDGTPQRADVESRKYTRFIIPVTPQVLDKELQIVVTPLNGDPDLLVSRSNPQVNFTDYEWISRSFGGDAVTIASTFHQGTEAYYIGVYGFSACSFTILASFESPITLADGVPQSDYVTSGGGKIYTLHTSGNSHDDVTITVTPQVIGKRKELITKTKKKSTFC